MATEKAFSQMTEEEKRVKFEEYMAHEGHINYERTFLEDFRKRFSTEVEGEELEDIQMDLLNDFASAIIGHYQHAIESVEVDTVLDSVVRDWTPQSKSQ